jgi:hypothetical protein
VSRGRGRFRWLPSGVSILDTTRSGLVGLCPLPPRPCRSATGLTAASRRVLEVFRFAPMPVLPPCGARPDNDPPDLGLLSRALPSCPGRKRANTHRPSSPGVRTRHALRHAGLLRPSVDHPKGSPPESRIPSRSSRRSSRRRKRQDRARPLPEHRSDRARTTTDVTRDRRFSSGGLFGQGQPCPRIPVPTSRFCTASPACSARGPQALPPAADPGVRCVCDRGNHGLLAAHSPLGGHHPAPAPPRSPAAIAPVPFQSPAPPAPRARVSAPTSRWKPPVPFDFEALLRCVAGLHPPIVADRQWPVLPGLQAPQFHLRIGTSKNDPRTVPLGVTRRC